MSLPEGFDVAALPEGPFVVRVDPQFCVAGATDDSGAALVEALVEATGRMDFIVVRCEGDFEVLSEVAMKDAGWVRADSGVSSPVAP